MSSLPDIILPSFRRRTRSFLDEDREVSQVLFRLSRWENLEYAKKI